jgi:HD-GYP domain-containing protein (c-di-GMP phosphodiesterase class II)
VNVEQVIARFAAAINMRTLYPANHPRVSGAVDQIVTAIQSALEQSGGEALTFLIVGDDLVVGQQVLRKESLSQRQMVSTLKRRGIQRLTFTAGLDAAECHGFVAALAVGETPRSSAHIILGRVEVALDEERPEAETERKRGDLAENLNIVREAFARFRTDRKLPLGPIEDLIWGLIDSLSRTTRAVLPLAKLKEHDEYTFIHSVNVSLLVMAQAQSFGIHGTLLHSFGMAALLHDIGKLMVPLEVLNHPGKLEGEAWELMKSHAERGAWYLSELEGAPPLAIVVAYEHHMRVDGQPNYPEPSAARVPNVASRMTSIADTYDAMSTVRPYQKPLMRATALEILQKRAGSFYDPVLVANFAPLVSEVSLPA